MKNFQCPRCKKLSMQDKWNDATEVAYGSFIVEIQNCEGGASFICPACQKECYREDIQ